MVYVSSADEDNPAIYSYDIETMELIKKFTDKGNQDLIHPCGMAIDANYLYVLSQDTKSLLRFTKSDGTYKVLIHGFTDYPEDLLLIQSCPKAALVANHTRTLSTRAMVNHKVNILPMLYVLIGAGVIMLAAGMALVFLRLVKTKPSIRKSLLSEIYDI